MIAVMERPREIFQLLARIRSEYLEMPGMSLTLAQARRLWGLDEQRCGQALDALVEAGFLRPTPRGSFVRASA